MIQKVPFKKGIDAYEKEQFGIAISEFSKVPLHGEHYAESQKYLYLINYKILFNQIRISSENSHDSNSRKYNDLYPDIANKLKSDFLDDKTKDGVHIVFCIKNIKCNHK